MALAPTNIADAGASTDDRDNTAQMIEQKLQEAIETLRMDAARVELWASALSCFTRPIPDYEFERRHRLKDGPKSPSEGG
jgi:hypothetical protein